MAMADNTAPAPLGAGGKALRVSVLPSARVCLSKRRFVIHISRSKSKLRTAMVKVDVRTVKLRKGRKWTATINLKGKDKKKVTVQSTDKLTSGRTYS